MANLLDPVTLSSWPTCKDCLAWSEDNLAVAGGEVIYILTPHSAIPDTRTSLGYWYTESLRINQFEEHEWPLQSLAPLYDFSIGEEQSNSHVVSLAWSPAGIGIHRRSVLAVLTSNLVLSIWESNGLPDTWKRSLILNHHLTVDDNSRKSSVLRRQKRVRAFAWLPALKLGQHQAHNRWGIQHLLVADDNDTLIVFKICKDKSFAFGSWTVERVALCGIDDDSINIDHAGHQVSALQSLLQKGSVTRIESERWVQAPESTHKDYMPQLLSLRVHKGPSMLSQIVQVYNLVATHPPTESASTINLELKRVHSTSIAPHEQHLEEADLHLAISKPCADFNKQYNLKGRYTVRIWGTTQSSDNKYIATCITLHPSDTIEYTIPSAERCTVVFVPAKSVMGIDDPVPGQEVVHTKILTFIAEHADDGNTKSDLDNKVLELATDCIRAAFYRNLWLTKWATANVSSIPADNRHEVDFTEHCEFCNSSVTVTSDLAHARCLKGHHFTRCGISFLAIQEPGISKYCSRCGKQFLSLSKLETVDGPSLVRALFEEFDVCPYCQGKFRG